MDKKKKVAIAVVATIGITAVAYLAMKKAPTAPPAKTIEVFGPAVPLPPSPSPPPPSPIAVPVLLPPTYVPVAQPGAVGTAPVLQAPPGSPPPPPAPAKAQPFAYTFEVDVFFNDLDPVTGLPTRVPLPGASVLIGTPDEIRGTVYNPATNGGMPGAVVESSVLPGPVSGITDTNGVFKASVSGVIGTSESMYSTGQLALDGTNLYACCTIIQDVLVFSGSVSSPQTYSWNPRGTQVQAKYASFRFELGGPTKVTVEIVSLALANYLGP